MKESQTKIEELKKQIQDIKGVKRCTTCGAEIPENATICSFCGAGIAKHKTVDASNLIKCDNCGKMVEKGIKKALKKETGAKFDVKFSAYTLASLKKGIFKSIEITYLPRSIFRILELAVRASGPVTP